MPLFRRRPDIASSATSEAPSDAPGVEAAGAAATDARLSDPAGPPDGRVVAAQVRGLSKIYGTGDASVVALDNVSLDLYEREFTAIMGPSGSGKSTLMHCVAGLDAATAGQVMVGGVALSTLDDRNLTLLRRERIGFVFQAFNLIPTLTAEENILLPLSIAGRKPDPQWYRMVIETIGLADRLSHKPSELSGGQQQRVACARAIVSRPQIIFADEPTGNLDSRSGAEVLGFLRRSVEEFGQTVVMVTHDPIAASYSDRVVFLADGRVVSELRNPSPDMVLATMARLDPTLGQARTSATPTGRPDTVPPVGDIASAALGTDR